MRLLVALLLCIAIFPAKVKCLPSITTAEGVQDIREFPWNAILRLVYKLEVGQKIQEIERGRWSASIIGKRKILTAGHCTCGIEAKNFQIKVGATTKESWDGAWYNIVKKYEHPQLLIKPYFGCRHRNYFTPNDIAILETDVDIEFNDKVKPIPVDFSMLPDTMNEMDVTTVGYGRMQWGYHGLKYAKTHARSCTIMDSIMLCTYRNQNSIFRGDAGGSMVTYKGGSYRLIGVNQGEDGGENQSVGGWIYEDRRLPMNYYVSTQTQESFIKQHM